MSVDDNASPSGPRPEEEADDQQWFDLMAGRTGGDVRPRTRDEAAWLRAALLAYTPAPPAGAMPDPAQRVQLLLDKARRAGVLGVPALPPARAPRASAWASWSVWLRRSPQSGAVGLTLAALLAVVVLRPPVPEAPTPETERGATVQQLVVANPQSRQQALVQALRTAGLDAQPYERLGRAGVDIALPVPLAPAQAQALRQAGLLPPGGPVLQVELLDAPGPAGAASAERP